MATLTKSFGIKAESMSEDGGTVTGYASTFSRERDSYGDVVAKGAFLDTLEAWKSKNEQGRFIPLLWGHDTDNPESNIGRVISAEEDDFGLLITAELDSENEKAQYVRRLLKQGRVYQFSFAYGVLDQATIQLEDGTDANELRKLDLYEISIVPLPANRHAEVTDVKDANRDTSVVEVKSAPAAVKAVDLDDVISEGIQGATGLLVQDVAVKFTPDALPEVTISAVMPPDGVKAGRRNSKADEESLREILDSCRDAGEELARIQSIVNGLLDGAEPPAPDEQEPKAEAGKAEANAEEPRGANAEEPEAKSAETDALMQQARQLLDEKEA